jgi:peptidyl-prolyl cis-trans isomerase B (cyclophilin B)
LDWQYTVFGEVSQGLDTVDKILGVRKDGNDNPLERVEMTVMVRPQA